MNEEDVDEYLHYISRSSTEYYLSGRYKSELYLTQNKLSDSESEDNEADFKPRNGFHLGSKPLPPAKLELPPHEIETRIEDFLSKFKQSGMGILAKESVSFAFPDEGLEGKSTNVDRPETKPRRRCNPRMARSVVVLKHKGSNARNARDPFDPSNNFRTSWISNESSTPSCPRQSMTSPSDNNFLSSSLTSSGFSDLGDDGWLPDFPPDDFDYPDRGDSAFSRKIGRSSSDSASIFRLLLRTGIASSGRAMGESNCILTILDVANVLQNNFAFISGGTSRRDFTLVSFPECPSYSTISDDHFKSVASYLCSILSPAEQESGVVVVVDRRQDKWASVKTLLIQITNFFPTSVHKIYVLRPLSFLQKTFADTGLRFIKEEFRVKVLILDSVEVLHDYIDKDQLTVEFGGGLAFNLSEWIQHRAALEKFAGNAILTKQNMLTICRNLQEREFPNDVKQTEALMRDHEIVKRETEEDVKSTVDHGRVLVECFIGPDASPGEEGLKSLPKSKLNHIAAARRLLSQVEEAAKSFESFWNLHKTKLDQCLQLRKFEEDFKQLQYTCDKHLSYLESLKITCDSGIEASDLLNELKKFEETSKGDFNQAEMLKFRGEKFIGENHYALDCIRPKCSELQRIADVYAQLMTHDLEVASKSKELFDFIENAERWCSKGMDFLASQAIERNQSPEEITKSISDLDSLAGGYKSFGFADPKEFHRKFDSMLTPQLKMTMESILSRSEDVQDMLNKCRTKLCSQIVVRPSPKPVHIVQPERPAKLSPPILLLPIRNGKEEEEGGGLCNGQRSDTLSPFSASMVNLKEPAPNLDSQQEPERTKPKRKFSLKKLGKLERRFSKSTHNLESIRSKSSLNPERDDIMAIRRSEIMSEIVSAETLYIDGLQLVLKNYIDQLDSNDMSDMIPEELVGRKRELFSNWSDIFSFHSNTFSKELESAESMNLVEAFCFSFLIHKDDLMKLYVDFCKNKIASTELLQKVVNCDFMRECQRRASTNEPLDVLLGKPFQQLQIYHRHLKELVKYCTQDQGLESTKECIEVIGKIIEKSSSAMNIIAIEGFEGDLSAGGKLIQQGSFIVQTEGGKSWGFLKGKSGTARHLFLYEAFIVVCKKMETNGNDGPTYQFKSLLPTSDLALTENVKGDKKKFQLSLHKANESFVIQASSINVKDFWVSEIKRILLGQFEKIKSDNVNRNTFKACERSISINMGNSLRPPNNNNNNNNLNGSVNRRKSQLSSSMVDLSKIPGQTYTVVRNHSATRPDELSLTSGTEVIIIDSSEEGWSLIREVNSPRNEGWLPSNLLVRSKSSFPPNSLIKENHVWAHSNESMEQPA